MPWIKQYREQGIYCPRGARRSSKQKAEQADMARLAGRLHIKGMPASKKLRKWMWNRTNMTYGKAPGDPPRPQALAQGTCNRM